MATPLIDTAFTSGELSPGLFGSTDLARFHSAAATMRNCFVAVQRGTYSRAGTAFVGFSKQTGRTVPPRLIPFQFSLAQGLVLEFGNFYMRVISDGAFVTEAPLPISNITNANPGVITLTESQAASATSNNAAISASYAPGDTVSLAGGTFSTRAVLGVSTTTLVLLDLNSGGTGLYAPGQVISLIGGTQTETAQVQVVTTTVTALSIYFGGGGLTNGTQTATGVTGTGTKWQASVTVSGGVVVAIGSIITGGQYTVLPIYGDRDIVSVPGGGSAQAPIFDIQMSVDTFTISNAGVFTANPAGAAFTSVPTSSGIGATFNTAIMGPSLLTVTTPGAYSAVPANPVAQSSTSGSGSGATFNLTWTQPGGINNGDWVYVQGVGGMTQVNGQTFVAAGVSGNTFSLQDIYGNNVNTTTFGAYTSGGMVSRIYTLSSPYAEADLPYLKFTESADVMSLCCVNQQTNTEYSAYDLGRITDDDWTFTALSTAQTVSPPPAASATASSSGSVDYEYVVTAISPSDGTESIASPIASIASAVDIASTAGTITIKWTVSSTPNVLAYNIYKAEPGYSSTPPVGALFGFAGQAYGTQFLDSNIVADFTQVPPTHQNPFARGTLLGFTIANGGASYVAPVGTINTNTGSGGVFAFVVIGGVIVDIIVLDPGQNYLPTDTFTITDGSGSGASVTLNIGPQSGTYPSVPAYFQERRGYANTLNNPDTYFFSQPGSFTNFDSRIPTIDTDAITGSPWSTQVNGIQFMITTSGGLLIFTGLSVWLLVGSGSFATNVTPISPSSQNVNPQPEIGCSATVMPIKVDYDVLYLSSKGSIYFDLPYQLYALSAPLDITVTSSHLFTDHTIIEHAWCREPYKLLWAIRDDGILLSLTWLKPEQLAGWARHDTNGTFESVASITEPPVDALYCATQRQIGANTPYIIERMDNRLWQAAEDAWCVDCGFSLDQPTPAATLTASSANGLGAVTGITGLVGGQNYSAATTASIVDGPINVNGTVGPGTGAVVTAVAITAGVITGVTISPEGTKFLNPQITFTDPAGSAGGSGASATCVLSNSMTFTASAAVFSSGNVGSVIRMGGGIASITAFTDSEHVTGNILVPIGQVIPNSGGIPQPALAGDWTMTAPVSSVYIPQLAGATLTGLADGKNIPPTLVPTNGVFPLPQAASAVTIGFGFTVQLQSVYLDAGEPTQQGSRKKVADVTVRLYASRGVQIGTNQVDGSTLAPPQVEVGWTNLEPVIMGQFGSFNEICPPLVTGDSLAIPVTGGYQKPGQVAIQQVNPLPMNITALIPSMLGGDKPEQAASPRQNQRGSVRG